MAYFSNGTEGAILDEQCCECLEAMKDELLCPVHNVSVFFNYDQTNNNELRRCLSALVADDGTCRMRQALKQAGVILDVSERDQLSLEGL